jgi:hypothetical protein
MVLGMVADLTLFFNWRVNNGYSEQAKDLGTLYLPELAHNIVVRVIHHVA